MERFKVGGENTPRTESYRGFVLRKCWCGYPEMRWLIYFAEKCYGSAKSLFVAQRKCDFILANFAL